MVVLPHLRFITCLGVNRANPPDQALPLEGGKGTVNRIQGELRHFRFQPGMQVFRGWVITSIQQFQVNPEPLVSYFQVGPRTG